MFLKVLLNYAQVAPEGSTTKSRFPQGALNHNVKIFQPIVIDAIYDKQFSYVDLFISPFVFYPNSTHSSH